MKSLLIYSAVLSLLFTGVSCSNGDDGGYTPPPTNPAIVNFTANLKPPTGVTSTASGSAALKMNVTSKTFEITVNYTGLTPTHGHIHRTDGAVEIPFSDTAVATSPFTVTGSLTDAQILGIMTETYYVNLHTTAYPNGEISGTLTKTGSSGGGGGGGGY